MRYSSMTRFRCVLHASDDQQLCVITSAYVPDIHDTHDLQCGLGRTGKLWCHSHYPIDCHPDVLTMAKPLANGIPVGAIMMKDSVADVVKLGDHGTTFG